MKGVILRGLTRKSIVITGMVAAVVCLAVVLMVSHHPGPSPAQDSDARLKRKLDRLRSVPYTSLSSEKATASESGVRIYDRRRAWFGYNLYCSETLPEAYLLDMEGAVVHTWTYPDYKPRRWFDVEMLGNGDLLIVNLNNSLMKLDWNSDLLWVRRMIVHHEVTFVPEDSTIYVLSSETAEHRGKPVRFDVILHLNASGEKIERWSTHDHLDEIKSAFDQRSFLDVFLDSLTVDEDGFLSESIPGKFQVITTKPGPRYYEYFHSNTINILPTTPLGVGDPRFRPGNLLTCFRNVNQVAILDKDTKHILWVWGEGELEWPHYPVMLEDGNILIYDNGVVREYSRVIEVNPVAGKIEWEYKADPPQKFYNSGKGCAQRLPNGNTLICDSNNGRVFEVAREGETVWEWFNPAAKEGHREQIYRMLRLSPDVVEPLLRDRGSGTSS
jgi:hypothetical protein